MTGWTNPMTILSGLMAWLMLSSVIALRQRDKDKTEEQFEKVLFVLAAGGLSATALFFALIILQLVLAIANASVVAVARG